MASGVGGLPADCLPAPRPRGLRLGRETQRSCTLKPCGSRELAAQELSTTTRGARASEEGVPGRRRRERVQPQCSSPSGQGADPDRVRMRGRAPDRSSLSSTSCKQADMPTCKQANRQTCRQASGPAGSSIPRASLGPGPPIPQLCSQPGGRSCGQSGCPSSMQTGKHANRHPGRKAACDDCRHVEGTTRRDIAAFRLRESLGNMEARHAETQPAEYLV